MKKQGSKGYQQRSITLQILEYNRGECSKIARDLASILSLNHPRRLEIENQLNELNLKINNIRQNEK